MRLHLFSLLFCAGALSAVAASAPKAAAESRCTAVRENCKPQTITADSVIRFVEAFYARYVFGTDDPAEAIRRHCSPELQRQLHEHYGYDDGYAVWMFRTGLQDGPENRSEVSAVTPQGEGLYKVNFIDMGTPGIDMGTPGSRTLKIIVARGTLIIDAIK